MKKLQKLIEYGKNYTEYKPIHDELKKLQNGWTNKRDKYEEELAGQLTAFGNDKKKKTAEDIEKCNRIRRNVADMERTGDYSKALRMFAEELTGFLSYFPKEGTLFVLDEPNRLNERMELILYEYTESKIGRAHV